MSANLYDIYQWKTPDDGQRNCPKNVEFYSKNKFEKLVHLVDFILKIKFGWFTIFATSARPKAQTKAA